MNGLLSVSARQARHARIGEPSPLHVAPARYRDLLVGCGKERLRRLGEQVLKALGEWVLKALGDGAL